MALYLTANSHISDIHFAPKSETQISGASQDINSIEFQQGDSDYFLYDVDETNLGGNFLYIF